MKYPFKTEIFREEVIIRTLRDESMENIGFECVIRLRDSGLTEFNAVGTTPEEAFGQALRHKERHEH